MKEKTEQNSLLKPGETLDKEEQVHAEAQCGRVSKHVLIYSDRGDCIEATVLLMGDMHDN